MKGTTTLSVRVAAGYNPGKGAARKEGEAAWEPAVSATRHPPSSAGSLAFACRASGRTRGTPLSWPGMPTPSAGRPSGCPNGPRKTPLAVPAAPRFARCRGPEEGCKNLAVFFHACTFDCLYCQNWQYRLKTSDPATSTPESLAAPVDRWTTCICYFGGDPAAQLPFALEVSRAATSRARGRILRVCWETNGSVSERLPGEVGGSSLSTGRGVKF